MKRYYQILKDAYLRTLGVAVPPRYQSAFVHWGGGAETHYIYKRFLKDVPGGARALVVGAMGGRDYFLCKSLGYAVVAVDLGPQVEIDNLVCCNIEDPLPFRDAHFDVVYISEVLEHLGHDLQALQQIRRVIKPDGKLIVSLPFYQDWEAGHVRIHSPESGKRLLAMAGFTVEDYVERPGVLMVRRLNILQHGLSLLVYGLTGKTAYPWLTRGYGACEWRLGHRLWLRKIRQLSGSFGGYYLCSKAATWNYVALNRALYTTARSA